MRLLYLLGVVVVFLSLTGLSQAAILTFDDPNNLGVALSGGMLWSNTGGGHIYEEYFGNHHYVTFSAPTHVNSFQMNGLPWQDYGGGIDGTAGIASINAFDGANNLLWSATVNLSQYATWNNWLTVDVNTDNIVSMDFLPTGTIDPWVPGFWPSVDNMVINESSAIPEPATIIIWSLLGCLGVASVARRRKRKIGL
jgi:hypothetical protein